MPFVKRKKRPEISSPTNFEHRVHSGYDHDNGVFVGLPAQWNSIISETENENKKTSDLQYSQNNCLNNAKQRFLLSLNNSRPKPIVDPSRITPNELNLFKVLIYKLVTNYYV